MKPTTKLTYLLLLIYSIAFAQQERGIIGEENWLDNWTEFNLKTVNYGTASYILSGDISEDITLTKRNIYLLKGNVFVTNNATLTIEPGTIILGDADSKATLTITKGAKIMAEGKLTDPIVFSSNKNFKKAGDWGGVILLGDAPTNRTGSSSATSYYPNIAPSDYAKAVFGGENKESNSGVLQFVRIEYAGKKVKNASSSNAIIFGGIGNKTVINNIMVSYSGANAINVMGGHVTMEQMVSYRARGNDYNFNSGVKCNIMNSLAIRSPYVSSTNGSRCLDVSSFNKNEGIGFSENETKVFAKNMTLLTDTKDLEFDLQSGLIREAIYVGAHTQFKIEKSVISGFSKAAILDETIELNTGNLEKIQFVNSYFNKCKGNVFIENNMNNEDLENWYGNPVYLNLYSKGMHSETFIDVDGKRPDFRLRIDKIIAMRN